MLKPGLAPGWAACLCLCFQPSSFEIRPNTPEKKSPAHPCAQEPKKDEGSPMRAQLVGRSPPIRPRSLGRMIHEGRPASWPRRPRSPERKCSHKHYAATLHSYRHSYIKYRATCALKRDGLLLTWWFEHREDMQRSKQDAKYKGRPTASTKPRKQSRRNKGYSTTKYLPQANVYRM